MPQIRSVGLAENVRNWDSLIPLAQEHGMSPMLFLRLAETGPAVPRAAHDKLRADYERDAFHSLANAAELIDLLKKFDR